MNNQKLELTWIGKDIHREIEPRILIEDKNKSYGDKNTENMLIHGDNLLALKALEQDYTGKIKCIYIDPPYNTGSAFEHYDDNLEHSIWLNLMKDRLKILYRLLSEDGLIWVSLDDNEAHYLKVLMDELYGRKNFLADVVWEKADSPRMDAKLFSSRYDHTLVFAKNIDKVKINQVKVDEVPEHYNKVDNEGHRYYLKPLRYMGTADAREDRPNLYYAITAPNGEKVFPKRTNGTDGRWRWSKEKYEKEKYKIEFIKTKDGWSVYTKIFANENMTKPPETLWRYEEVGSNRNAKNEINQLFRNEKFDTPKPEKLIERILEISTNKGDFVLDSFLGSGTTCAVAHKMKRKWIGVELGEHCYKLCKVRMDKVIEGNDEGGITQSQSWKGGGGYKFYELAPSLLAKDKFNNWIISENYNGELLTKAICKQEKFTYEPEECYWKQGKSSENDYIFVTTNYVSLEYLKSIEEEMKENESLLICCKSYQEECETANDRITVKKIPQAILKNCEYGVDDYSLNIKEVLNMEDNEDE